MFRKLIPGAAVLLVGLWGAVGQSANAVDPAATADTSTTATATGTSTPAVLCETAVDLQRISTGGKFLLPWFSERLDADPLTGTTWDTELSFAFTGSTETTVYVYLYGADGSLIESSGGGAVCGACTVSFTSPGRQVVSLQDLFSAAGLTGTVEGYAWVLTVGGSEAVSPLALVRGCSSV